MKQSREGQIERSGAVRVEQGQEGLQGEVLVEAAEHSRSPRLPFPLKGLTGGAGTTAALWNLESRS